MSFAVLECARGGILRHGLGFDRCDTAIVTNVAEDHLGLSGIETVDEMAYVKSVVPESIRKGGLAILNENNEHSYKMKDRLNCEVALFSANGRSKRVTGHWRKGGMAAFYDDKKIMLVHDKRTILNLSIRDIPLAMNGQAVFQIENILAALLAAYFNRIDVKYILAGLRSFIPSFKKTPGRLNHIKFRNFDFILDYAHNIHSIEALGSYLKKIRYSQKIGIVSAPGDRRESDIIGIGKAAAEIFDRIIIRIDEGDT